MTSTIWAQAIMEHAALSGMAARVSYTFDVVQANFAEHQTAWLIAGGVVLVMLLRRRR
jgi:hypothetical protein